MKKVVLAATVAMFMMVGFSFMAAPAKSEMTIDTLVSKVFWTGKKVTGQHTGYISISEGKISMNGDNVVGAEINIDMNSIVCTDITDAGYNQKLVGHLKSDDFFSSAKHGTATFKAESLKPIKNAKEGENNYTATGKLTIKGFTNTVTFPLRTYMKEGMLFVKGTASFDRTKYSIKYGSGSFFDNLGDKAIENNIEISFDVIAKK